MGYLLAITAVFFWSFNIIIASYFAFSLTPWEIAFGRWFIAGLILVPFTIKGIIDNWNIILKHWLLIVGLSLSGIVILNSLIYYAGRTASPIDMGLLDLTGPIFLIILSHIFLKTTISVQQIIGLIIAVFGVVIIIMQGDLTQISKFKFVIGDGLMLLNSLCFATYALLQARRPKEISQSTMLGITNIVGLLILLPIVMSTISTAKIQELNELDWAVFLYLGIFNSVLSYLAWNNALAKIGNIKTGIIFYLLPLFSGIEAYFILDEKFYISQLFGGAFVILGIIMVTLKKKPKKDLAKS